MTRRAVQGSGPRPLRLVLWVAALIATLGNWPLWQALAELGLLSSAKGWGLAVALGVAVFGAMLALLSLLAWRFTLKPAAIFLLLAAAAGAHFMAAYRIVIDHTMLVNVLQTNPGEAADLVSLRMAATLVLGGLLPAWGVWRTPVDFGRFGSRLGRNLGAALLGLALVVAAVLASFQPLSSTMRNHKQLRYLINPLNSVYALGMVATEPLRRNDRVLLPLGEDARLGAGPAAGAKPPLLLLVVGETARADHFALNGYPRDTDPELRALDVLSFRNVTSCGTNTAASLPCMVSHLGRTAHEARSHNYENLLDLLQHAGLAVLWIENQAGCKEVCDRVPHTRSEQPAPGATPPDARLCPNGECLDEAMLHGLDARLAALPATQRAHGVVLVIHQMGSHGPAYSQRSPADRKRFTPECTSTVLQQCDHQRLVNAYDNSIAYTDHVLAQSVRWLRQQTASYDPAMLYLSDHGESLGENNLYLHGLPYAIAPDVQKRVPWITWLSPGYAQRQRLDVDCLRGRADAEISHDHLFHSVLGLLDVQTSAWQRALDAYAPCRPG